MPQLLLHSAIASNCSIRQHIADVVFSIQMCSSSQLRIQLCYLHSSVQLLFQV